MSKIYNIIVCVPKSPTVPNGFVKYRQVNNLDRFKKFLVERYADWRFYTLYDSKTREKIEVVKR